MWDYTWYVVVCIVQQLAKIKCINLKNLNASTSQILSQNWPPYEKMKCILSYMFYLENTRIPPVTNTQSSNSLGFFPILRLLGAKVGLFSSVCIKTQLQWSAAISLPLLSISSDSGDLCSILSDVSAAEMINQYTAGQITWMALYLRMQVFQFMVLSPGACLISGLYFMNTLLLMLSKFWGTHCLHAKLPKYAPI